jgi:deoxyxylulose-5-phosphate synthase
MIYRNANELFEKFFGDTPTYQYYKKTSVKDTDAAGNAHKDLGGQYISPVQERNLEAIFEVKKEVKEIKRQAKSRNFDFYKTISL